MVIKLWWDEDNTVKKWTMNIDLGMSTLKKSKARFGVYWKHGLWSSNGNNPQRTFRALLLGPLRENGPFCGKRYFPSETLFCPGQHLKVQHVIEKASFSFTATAPPVSHFTYPQSHLLAQACLLGSWPDSQASVCHVLRLTRKAK